FWAPAAPNAASANTPAPIARTRLKPCLAFMVAASGMDLDHHAFGEDLLDLGMAVRDPLLENVAQELLERRPVLLHPERERIAAEHLAHAPCVSGEPRQRIARDRLLVHSLERAVLRSVECVVEAARDPRMPIENVSLDRDHVHDRPDLGARVILLLHLQ